MTAGRRLLSIRSRSTRSSGSPSGASRNTGTQPVTAFRGRVDERYFDNLPAMVWRVVLTGSGGSDHDPRRHWVRCSAPFRPRRPPRRPAPLFEMGARDRGHGMGRRHQLLGLRSRRPDRDGHLSGPAPLSARQDNGHGGHRAAAGKLGLRRTRRGAFTRSIPKPARRCRSTARCGRARSA
jgi:hypothetical protein